MIATATKRENYDEIRDTNQPFLVTLVTFFIKPLGGYNQASPRPSSSECMFINPPLEHAAEAAFAQNTVRPEVPSGRLKFIIAETLKIGGL